MDCVRHFMGHCDFGRDYENAQSKTATKMDCCVVSGYGVDIVVHIAGNVA